MAELFCDSQETFQERMSRLLRSSWVVIVPLLRGAVAIAERRSHLEDRLRGQDARLLMLLRTSPHFLSRLPGDRLDSGVALPGGCQDSGQALLQFRRLHASPTLTH